MKIDHTDKLDFKIPDEFEFKFIELEHRFNLYKITYSYKTMRGNKRDNFKYILADYTDDANFKFIEYINKFNTENEHRAVTNVKILVTELVGTVTK